MSSLRLNLGLAVALAALCVLGVMLGETPLSQSQWAQAFHDLHSGPAEVLWHIRAPRTCAAAVVGAALCARPRPRRMIVRRVVRALAAHVDPAFELCAADRCEVELR